MKQQIKTPCGKPIRYAWKTSHKFLEKFSKNLYGTAAGTYSSRFLRPVMNCFQAFDSSGVVTTNSDNKKMEPTTTVFYVTKQFMYVNMYDLWKKTVQGPPSPRSEVRQNNKHKLVSHIAISLIKTILMFWTRRFEEGFNLS